MPAGWRERASHSPAQHGREMTGTESESVPGSRFPHERLTPVLTPGREWPVARVHSVRSHPAAPRQGTFKNASKAPAAPRLSAAVSVCGKGPVVTVEAALARLSAVLSLRPRVDYRARSAMSDIFERSQKLSRMNEQTPKPPTDPLALRKTLTFEQAEGVEPLPRQLRLKQLSKELRAKLWFVVHESLDEHAFRSVDAAGFRGGVIFREPWDEIFRVMHVDRDHNMIDDFKNDFRFLLEKTRVVLETGDYVALFGWIQWVLRHPRCPPDLAENIDFVLKHSRAAYRVVDGNTIIPIGSEAELATIEQAFADVASAEFHGSRAHLRKASEELTTGHYADSIRESIHAVEATARVLSPGATGLNSALDRLESKLKIHQKLKLGFVNLYGFSSDERGIRHPLIDDGTAKVDETDALFMIGACAAFVSYLINKARTAGLLTG
jgi:hypothetical protein